MLSGFKLIRVQMINEVAKATWSLIAYCFPTIGAKLNLSARWILLPAAKASRKFKPHRCGIVFALLFVLPFLHVDAALAQSFNAISFVIVTGGDDLRGDSSATATLRSPDRSPLQVIALKDPTGDAWDNYTTHVVTVPLNPPLTPSQIGSIVITLTSHNSSTETDDNWNVQSVNVYLNNLSNN